MKQIFTFLMCFALPANAGNVIFFHPDGMSLSHWTAIRLVTEGPDGDTHWDKLPYSAVYRGHMKDSLSATSNGGATTHAYGVKVQASSFGTDGKSPVQSYSGFQGSIMKEAQSKGKAVALVQSGFISEPGTAAFMASHPAREDYQEIAKQVLFSLPDLHMSGGERYLLPKGVKGRFGVGERTDDLNLIEWAKNKGYSVVYTKQELNDLVLSLKNKKTQKILGVFAWSHTFNDLTEEELNQKNLPLYEQSAPSISEMSQAALSFLSSLGKEFLLVIEEEGTDNFSNKNNAAGFIEAGVRANQAISHLSNFVLKNKNTLLLMASDSDAGGLQIYGNSPDKLAINQKLPASHKEAHVIDGQSGAGSLPFVSKPDRFGVVHPFGIAWAGTGDFTGGILAKAQGKNASLVRGSLDNTQIYKIIRDTLFSR